MIIIQEINYYSHIKEVINGHVKHAHKITAAGVQIFHFEEEQRQ